jgi:hypothetical protein
MAAHLRPYEPDGLEQRIQKVDDVLTLMSGPVYPFVGSTFEGGGLAVGPGFRGRLGDTGAFDAHAGWSSRNYKTADATVTLPRFANGRATVALGANWLDAPGVAYYGGNGSRPEDRREFFYRTTTIGISTRFQATRLFAVGGGLDAIRSETGATGQSSSIVTVGPDYRRARVFAEIDSRTSPGYTRRGGLYRIEWSDYRQTNGHAFSFRRTDAEVRQFIPLLRENWIIALRALASTTSTGSGQEVPYFLMPDLGGSHWLRGYPAWRFRDRNRMLVSGEYRWTAGPLVDMALFLDAGKVAARAGDLDMRGIKKTYGAGVSFHTAASTLTRVEVARAPEGTSLTFSFSPSF